LTDERHSLRGRTPVTDKSLNTSREVSVARVFVEIADTLVGDFDRIDLLTTLATRSVELLDVAAAGILLADDAGGLHVMASSSETASLLELFQLENDEGPCLDCVATGEVVTVADLPAGSPWPHFAVQSVNVGFPAVCAVPMRLRGATTGCLNLFLAEPTAPSESDIALAQAFADVATIAVFQIRASRDGAQREEQLQHALTGRIVIEQAKGKIAERLGVGMDVAFSRLRNHARSSNERLSDVARGVVDGVIAIDTLVRQR
jgi:GAF domain-containing protein